MGDRPGILSVHLSLRLDTSTCIHRQSASIEPCESELGQAAALLCKRTVQSGMIQDQSGGQD